MAGQLLLNGGDEFRPGNEPQDRDLVRAARTGIAYVVPTAARRQRPELAVATARAWFAGLGLDVEELPVYTRSDAGSLELAARAAAAGLLYLTGGDPGLLVQTLRGSRVWDAMTAAWRDGAALAGSSAGAMALCQWTLVMARWPRHHERRPVEALGLVPGTAVLPHYERMGSRWSVADRPAGLTLLGIDERTAAVWTNGGGWHAAGAASVVVIGEGEPVAFRAGEPCAGLPDPTVPSSSEGEGQGGGPS
ncbi:MAG TPA: Type 1 glutamine amidotransferase-like domain-containing protein [Candidatus Dormibacteraeota bacterium]|nr:Type 1 glutamine amidotransferase-like domain-containing protein [Candidatus Dormibacteraeota bacterium]